MQWLGAQLQEWEVKARAFLSHSEEHFYAYSQRKELLDLSLRELREKGVKVKYVQVTCNHRCVPFDSFLSYDTFVIYTFANLVLPYGGAGYMNTYLRDRDHSHFFQIDFKEDFKYAGQGLARESWSTFLWLRSYLLYKCAMELFWLMCLVVTFAKF